MRKPKIYHTLRFARDYVHTRFLSYRTDDLFDDLESYVMFVGHGRSGHSVLGALLDAHPDIVLADEVDSLRFFSSGFDRNDLFRLIQIKSEQQASHKRQKGGLGGSSYSYYVPGQFQGRIRNLKIIGASKAGVTARRIGSDPELFSRFQDAVRVPIKVIHVIRNPFDNISTISIKQGISVDSAARKYFENNCDALVTVREHVDPADLLVIRHEDLISDPQDTLKQVLTFVGAELMPDSIKACAKIVFTSPSTTRSRVNWDTASIKMVEERIKSYDFLRSYS